MTRARLLVVVALGGLVPSSAFAAGPGAMEGALSLADTWTGQVLGLALGLWLGMLLLALLLEAFFKPPTEPKDMGGAVWRGLLVLLFLLHVPGGGSLYGRVCHAMAAQADSLATQLSPDAWGTFAKSQDAWMNQLNAKYSATDKATVGGDYQSSFMAGMLYDSLIALAVLLGQAAMWVMTILAQVLAALMYTLGPLALVFGVPRVSDSISRWLRSFISILTWPVLSAMMLHIIISGGAQGMSNKSPAFASVSTALLMAVAALAVPGVASSLVGGSVGALSAGLGTLMSGGARLAAAATRVGSLGGAEAGSAVGGAIGAASGAAGRLGGSASAPVASSGGSSTPVSGGSLEPTSAPPVESASGHAVAAADSASSQGVAASDSSEARRAARDEEGGGRRRNGPLPRGMVREADGSVAPAPPAGASHGAAGVADGELRGAVIQAAGAFAGGVVGGDLAGRHVAHAVRKEAGQEAAAPGDSRYPRPLREFDGGVALEIAAEKAIAARPPVFAGLVPEALPLAASPKRSLVGITEEMGSPPKPSTVGPPEPPAPLRGAPTRAERPVDSHEAPTMKPTSVMPKKP